MQISEKNGAVRVSGLQFFNVTQTFDCGQCFRFEIEGDTAKGYALGKYIEIKQISENEIELFPCTAEEFDLMWKDYLALDDDYAAIRAELSALRANDTSLAQSMQTGSGIRILHQQPWETLCSFIISQNNNIPRIKKIISALCKKGAMMTGLDETVFPCPKTLMDMGKDGLFELKTGFRAAYLYDAAEKVHNGQISLEDIRQMPFESATAELCKIKGVGPKVAACTLLFGFGKLQSFPIDVWVKKVMAEYYGGNVCADDFGRYAGVAQQYLFYNKRYIEG